MSNVASVSDPAAARGAAAAPDVIVAFSYTSWAGAARRGFVMPEDALARLVVGSERVGRAVIANPYRSAVAKAARRLGRDPEPGFPERPGRHVFEPLRLRRTDPVAPRAVERTVAAYERRLRARAELLGLERPAVISASPLLAGFGRFEWAGPVTYYTNDDLSAHPPLAPWWPAFELAYERMRRARRRVVGLTPRCVDRVGPTGPWAVEPCAVDPGEWIEPGPAPGWFTDLPAPRLVYVGTLDERIDVGRVRDLARALPEATLVFVGNGPTPSPLAALGAEPNVVVRPALASRRELTGMVAAADCGIVPHVATAQTAAMSPLKLFEYLAAGLPAAAPALEGITLIRDRSPRVELAPVGTSLAPAVRRALRAGRAPEAERLAFIAANSWQARVDRILDVALAD